MYYKQLKICSICRKITATDEDHLDCKEKRRIEIEDLKLKIPEKLDMEKNSNDLGIEIKALLDHIAKEKKDK